MNSSLATKANDNAVVHLAGTETISGNKSGSEKKDAAMSFLENALATVDAVAAREIVDPEKFKDGISKIIDGTVECLNASTWAAGRCAGSGGESGVVPCDISQVKNVNHGGHRGRRGNQREFTWI